MGVHRSVVRAGLEEGRGKGTMWSGQMFLVNPGSLGVHVVMIWRRGKQTRSRYMEVAKGDLEIGGIKYVVVKSRSVVGSSRFASLVGQEVCPTVPRVPRMPHYTSGLRHQENHKHASKNVEKV